MDISTLTSRSEKGYHDVAKVFYKLLFRLSKEPVVLSQCCNDNPAIPPDDNGLENCTASMITSAQKHLDDGKPVVIELFGRRTVDKGQGFLYDTVTVFVPGQKIDRDLIKNMTGQGQDTFEVVSSYN